MGPHHCHEDEERPQNERRHQGDTHPAASPADPVLRLLQRVERHTHERQIGRQNVGSAQLLAEEPETREPERRNDRSRSKRQQPPAAREAPGERQLAFFAVFRKKPHGGSGEPERRKAAEHENPRPYEDEDAVLVAAHPAGEHGLRHVKNCRSQYANGEREDGVALRARALFLCNENFTRITGKFAQPCHARHDECMRASGHCRLEWSTHGLIAHRHAALSPAHADVLALADGFGDTGPSPGSPGITLLGVKAGKEFSDVDCVQSMPSFEDAGHELDVPRRGRHVFVSVPIDCHRFPIDPVCSAGPFEE